MSTKQRIVMISTHGYIAAEPELGKPDTGGQVVYVLELSRCLGRMGYQVDILTRRFENQPKSETVADRVRVLRFPCGGNDFIAKETLADHLPEWTANVLRFIESKRIKYSFINSHYWDGGVAGLTLAGKLNIPHIHTPHSLGSWKRDNMDGSAEALEQEYNFRKRIREEKAVYDACDALVATTPQQRDIVAGGDYDVPAAKIFVVPPGYDDSRFYPVSEASRLALKAEHGLEGRIVLALGRVAENKGYDLLLQAMPVVFQRIDDAKLLLAIGSTEPSKPERAQIQQLKTLAHKLGLSSRVMFHDYISDEQLPDYYRMADVFALSSRYEPFGMTAVEAMACGTPSVVTTEGGLWEQVTWGLEAIYANPFDPEAFGHAICSVLRHERLTGQLAKFGSQKARSSFTWMGIAQQIVSILQGFRMRKSTAFLGAPSPPAEPPPREEQIIKEACRPILR